MHYDCHLEVSSFTPAQRVEQHLRCSQPPGVVFVQKGSDYRSRSEWLSCLERGHSACGVVRLDIQDFQLGIDRLSALGACGALISLQRFDTPARSQDEVLRLHDSLPRTWHVELDMPWSMAPKLAPSLARMDRTFSLAPQPSPSGHDPAAISTVLWWFDMGNVFLKLNGSQDGNSVHPLNRLVCGHAPDRVVLGSGQLNANADCWWSHEGLISPDLADHNAQCLYPFFAAGRSVPALGLKYCSP